jgi:uncharacterized protein
MKISLVGLSEGIHRLQFVEKRAELGLQNHPNLSDDVQIQVEIEKRSPHYFLKNFVRTTGHFVCDRCLEEFDLHLSEETRAVFSSDPELLGIPGNEEIHFIDPNMKEIDITTDIHDAVLLSIPMKVLCSEECRGLCAGCGVNLNDEACRCAERPADPRWEALRKFL